MLMEKRLSRNLMALEDLKKKVEEDPSNIATGSEDLKQLRTSELLIKLESLTWIMRVIQTTKKISKVSKI